jgi:uncharacterized membrane protein
MIVRKGLLFGVYVGEGAFDGKTARRIIRSWYAWMAGALVASLAVGIGTVLALPSPPLMILPVLVQLVAFLLLYLRAHFQARALAPSGPLPPAAATLGPAIATSTKLPLIALALGFLLGSYAVAYAWGHYADLPVRVPTHFGPSGKPDGWSPKSASAVMLLPFMSLFLGTALAGMAWLTGRAKRAIRLSDRGASLEAQLKFRSAVTRFLSGVAVLTAAMLAAMSVMTIDVGLGRRSGLSSGTLVLTIGLMAYAIGGTLYIAIRYGQGGARLERATSETPLTNGLADNRKWVLGLIYVNREDPSIFVERRFGFGYTVNLGNWKALLLLAIFLLVVLVIPLAASLLK